MTTITNAEHNREFEKPLNEIRCPKCQTLLAKGFIVKGRLEIKCTNKHCRELCRFVFKHWRDLAAAAKSANAKMSTGESQ